MKFLRKYSINKIPIKDNLIELFVFLPCLEYEYVHNRTVIFHFVVIIWWAWIWPMVELLSAKIWGCHCTPGYEALKSSEVLNCWISYETWSWMKSTFLVPRSFSTPIETGLKWNQIHLMLSLPLCNYFHNYPNYSYNYHRNHHSPSDFPFKIQKTLQRSRPRFDI